MTVRNINKMIDYCIKMPENDEYEKGHKYPYYSCEILCSMNGLNLEKILNTYDDDDDDDDNDNDDDNEIKDDDKDDNNNNDKNIDNKDDDKNEKEMKIDIDKNNDDKEEDKNKDEIEEDKDKNESENKNKNKDNNKKEKEKMEVDEDEYEEDAKYVKEKKKELPNYNLLNSVLDHFFSFLEVKSSVDNYVLMGYFNKITNYLIKTRTKIILNYMLNTRQNLINQLISHINRYSIANIITNILNALSENNTPEGNEQYMMIVNKLIEQFTVSDIDTISIDVICDLFIESIVYNNKIKLSKVTDANIINKFEIIMEKYFKNRVENKKKIISVTILLTKMNKSILSNFSHRITSTKNSDDNKNEMLNLIKLADKSNNQFYSLNNTRFDFKELVYKAFINNYTSYCDSINNICLFIINDLIEQNKENICEKIENSFSKEKSKKLGNNKLIEFDFINSVLDIYINLLGVVPGDDNKRDFINNKIKLILNTNIFKIIIDYYFEYNNNNFLVNLMTDLIKIIFDSDKVPEELILNILQINDKNEPNKEGNLISLLINDLSKNKKFIFEQTSNTTNNLLFASNISILKNIFSSKNPIIKEICNKMDKEKFFNDNFVRNVNSLFTKKLFRLDTDKDQPVSVFDSLRTGIGVSGQGNSDLEFSLESLNDIIDFYFKVNEKYLAGEDYMSLFKEREIRLEEIKNSSEYMKLYNNESESESEEEEEEYDNVDIPKPVFFNSKLDAKKKEENNDNLENKESNSSNQNNVNENNEKDNNNSNQNNVNESNEKVNNNSDKISDGNDIVENQQYNDVNFWHADIKEEEMEDILKDLL